jgi:hypothetical protein
MLLRGSETIRSSQFLLKRPEDTQLDTQLIHGFHALSEAQGFINSALNMPLTEPLLLFAAGPYIFRLSTASELYKCVVYVLLLCKDMYYT